MMWKASGSDVEDVSVLLGCCWRKVMVGRVVRGLSSRKWGLTWTAHARAQVTAFGTIKFVQVNLIGFFRRKATLRVDLRDMSLPDWNIDWIFTRLDWGGCEWRCRFH